MKFTIYGKKIEKQDKTKFVRYSATLKKKDGTEIYAVVKFNDRTNPPKYESLPMNIIVDKDKASLSDKLWNTVDDEGEVKTGINYTLWVKEWTEDKANPFKDHSLDDFE